MICDTAARVGDVSKVQHGENTLRAQHSWRYIYIYVVYALLHALPVEWIVDTTAYIPRIYIAVHI